MIREYLEHIVWDAPWMLALLVLIPLWYRKVIRREERGHDALRYAAADNLVVWHTPRLRWRRLPWMLMGAAMACLVVALAKPAHYETLETPSGGGIDLVICLDVSGSMLARDFKPDRLGAATRVAREFIEQRKGDRIGLVVFAGQSLSLCPLTTDHRVLLQQLNSISYGELADGTSIGTGLASAVDRLREAGSPSKVVILMTDGEDTGGFFDPSTALELAVTYGVKVYTIGVGSRGVAPMPYQTPMGTRLQEEKVNIDEALLTQIAGETGGRYFRATDTQALDSIYSSINLLEKSKVVAGTFIRRTDAFEHWLYAAILLLLISQVLRFTVFRTFPD